MLKNLAYKFYPKGIFESPDPTYADSVEQKRFKERKNDSIKQNSPNWSRLVYALQEHFGKSKVENLESLLHGNEKSFSACIAMEPVGTIGIKNLVLHISTLIDSYFIYQSDPAIALELFKVNPSESLFVAEDKYVSYIIEANLEPAYSFLKEEVSKYFPGFYEFPRSLIDTEILDIMHDGVGIFQDDKLNLLPDWRRKMTFYKAFFSSRYYAILL